MDHSKYFYGKAADFEIDQSIRFVQSTSSRISRTPSSTTTTRTKGTFSFWVKRSLQGSRGTVAADTSANFYLVQFLDTDRIYFGSSSEVGGSTAFAKDVDGCFRDPGAWYHFVFVYDTTLSTTADRLKIFVNGRRQENPSSESYISNPGSSDPFSFFNISGRTYDIGSRNHGSNDHPFDGYLAEMHFLDGTAIGSTDNIIDEFGEYDNNVWKPKKYSGGNYGTNGFYLTFDSTGVDGGTGDGAAAGADHSGQGNHWTVQSGVETTAISSSNFDNDIDYTDTPTKNWCTLNPGDVNVVGEANVRLGALATGTSPADNQVSLRSTHFKSSGKWYFEVHNPASSGTNIQAGWASHDNGHRFTTSGTGVHTRVLDEDSVTMVAADFDNNAIWFGKDGTWDNSATQSEIEAGTTTNASVTSVGNYPQSPCFLDQAGSFSGSGHFNFGQRDFIHTVPSGFKTLNTDEIAEPTIKDGRDHFDILTFSTTSGSTGTQTGLAFQPDLVWLKSRNNAFNSRWYDCIRGQGRFLVSSNPDEEDVGTTDGLTDFESDGFDHGDLGGTNNMVAWCWKAGGTPTADNSATSGAMSANSVALDGTLNTASGTSGAYTPAGSPSHYPLNMSINTTSRFSIIRYEGTGSNLTLPHGLGAKPGFIIIKNLERSNTNWNCYHQGLPTKNPTHDVIYLNLNEQQNANNSNVYRQDPDTNVFSLGSAGDVNTDGETYIAYCWAERPGFSKMGFFRGNGDGFGPFVYTGFRPAWVMIKNPNTNGTNWVIQDTKRHPFNPANGNLQANEPDSDSDGNRGPVDFLANGFKLRGDNDDANASNIMIYVAFAENPFGGEDTPPVTAR